MSEKQVSNSQNIKEDHMNSIKQAVEELNLDEDVLDISKIIYVKVYSENLYTGRSINKTLAGILYLSCKKAGCACKYEDLGDYFNLNETEKVLNVSKYISKCLDMKVNTYDPLSYISMLLEELEETETEIEIDTEEIRKLSKEIAEKSINEGLFSGKSPRGFAASSIYAASQELDENVTQKKLSDIAGVSSVTIRSNYVEQLNVYRNNIDD